MTSPSAPERVSQRLKEQFAPAYLTVTSIVQAVALTALVVRVEDLYPEFGVADWVLALATFLVMVDIWHEYLMTVLAYVWAPTLLDTLIPFGFLAAELFLAHFVNDLRPWLLCYGLVALIGLGAWLQGQLRARGLASENREIHAVLAGPYRYRGMLAAAAALLSLAGFGLYTLLGLDGAQLAVALIALAGIIAIIASSIPMWNRILRFAHGEPVAPARHPGSGDGREGQRLRRGGDRGRGWRHGRSGAR
ncbi:MAG TPA: hypothetical protein VH641_01975 [Streptosporangiaceae bacterium]|jgi:hypothetical protein